MEFEVPHVTKELLGFLKERYPDQTPREWIGEFELGQRIGVQKLIDHLQRIHDDQVKASLTGDLD